MLRSQIRQVRRTDRLHHRVYAAALAIMLAATPTVLTLAPPAGAQSTSTAAVTGPITGPITGPAVGLAPRTASLTLSATTSAPGAIITATGRLPGKVVRPLTVQWTISGVTRTLARTKTTKKGTFSVTAALPNQPGLTVTFRGVAPKVKIGRKKYAAVTTPSRTVVIEPRGATDGGAPGSSKPKPTSLPSPQPAQPTKGSAPAPSASVPVGPKPAGPIVNPTPGAGPSGDPGPAPWANALPLTLNAGPTEWVAPGQGASAPPQTQYLSVVANAGDVVSLGCATPDSDSLALRFTVLDLGGQVVPSGTLRCGATFTAPNSATYVVAAKAYTSTSQTIRLWASTPMPLTGTLDGPPIPYDTVVPGRGLVVTFSGNQGDLLSISHSTQTFVDWRCLPIVTDVTGVAAPGFGFGLWRLPTTGQYRVSFNPQYSCATTTGTIKLHRGPTPASVALNSSVPVSINEAHRLAVAQFVAPAGTSLRLRLTDLASVPAPNQSGAITVLDADGEFVAGGSPKSAQDLVVKKSGAHTVIVSWGGANTGSARLWISTPQDFEGTLNGPPVPVAPGVVPGRVQRIGFDAAAGDFVSYGRTDTVEWGGMDSPKLVSASGAELFYRDDPYYPGLDPSPFPVWTIPTSGRYYLVFKQEGTAPASAKVSLNRSAAPLSATIDGPARTLDLDRPGAVARAVFTAQAGQPLQIKPMPGYLGGEAVRVLVLDPTGAKVYPVYGDYYRAKQAGVYTVWVAAARGAVGTTSLAVSTPPPGAFSAPQG